MLATEKKGDYKIKKEIIRQEYEKALQELPRSEFDLYYCRETIKVPYQPCINEVLDIAEFIDVDKYFYIER